MADVIDIAEKLHSEQHERNIKEIREAAKRREFEPVGECYFCLTPFDEGDKRIFCNSSCATDHERLKLNKR